jgi:hypothetical protein
MVQIETELEEGKPIQFPAFLPFDWELGAMEVVVRPHPRDFKWGSRGLSAASRMQQSFRGGSVRRRGWQMIRRVRRRAGGDCGALALGWGVRWGPWRTAGAAESDGLGRRGGERRRTQIRPDSERRRRSRLFARVGSYHW